MVRKTYGQNTLLNNKSLIKDNIFVENILKKYIS